MLRQYCFVEQSFKFPPKILHKLELSRLLTCTIISRMEACPRLDMFPQPSFVCAQESSSLGLAVKKLIRVRQLTFNSSFYIYFVLFIYFFAPSVTIQRKSRRFPK